MLLPTALVTIIFPFLVYYLSTNIFYRRANSKALRKTPPTIPYFVPGAFHAFTLAYEGSQKFFGRLLKQYASFAPFTARAGFRSFVIIRDPAHLDIVMKASKPDDILAVHEEMMKTLFDSSIYPIPSSPYNKKLIQEIHALPQKHLAGAPLDSLVTRYTTLLSDNLNNKMFQPRTWTQIEDFWSFFQQVVLRCLLETLLGKELLKKYSGIVKEYRKFADGVEDWMPGMPSYALLTGYRAWREKLVDGMEKWVQAQDGAKIVEGAGNEKMESKFILERDALVTDIMGVGVRERAIEMLGVLHGSNLTITSPTFHSLIESLRQPNLTTQLTTVVSTHYTPNPLSYNIPAISALPLIQSLLAETKRLRTSTVLIRRNMVPGFQLDENWAIPKDALMLFFSRDFARNEKVWKEVGGRMLEKPVEEFCVERFLVPNNDHDSKIPAAAKRSAGKKLDTSNSTFNTQALDPLRPFFADSNSLLGQEYADAIHVATLSVFLTQFEMELCDDEEVPVRHPGDDEEDVADEKVEVAYGVVKPKHRVAVRIRMRGGGGT